MNIDKELSEKFSGPKYSAKSVALGGNIHRIIFTLRETGKVARDQTVLVKVVFTDNGYYIQPTKG